jgi:hypothetical protein
MQDCVQGGIAAQPDADAAEVTGTTFDSFP